MSAAQNDLFGPPSLPEGLLYRAEFVGRDEERELVAGFAGLEFKPFEFHGFLGKRRVASFGWRYDFGRGEPKAAEPVPDFLLPLRRRAGELAGLAEGDLPHVMVTEYEGGAAIGWHRDRPDFGEVIGVSLLSPCRFRLRRRAGSGWERAAFTAEPRSAYLLSGVARTEWEHSIPPVDALRYSVTFRSLAR